MVRRKSRLKLPLEPRIYRATLGSRGKVIRGSEITDAEAVAERQAGRDIVICGDNAKQNRRLAQKIENAIGPNKLEPPHKNAGDYVLPHFQPHPRSLSGHAFYETDKRKVALNP